MIYTANEPVYTVVTQQKGLYAANGNLKTGALVADETLTFKANIANLGSDSAYIILYVALFEDNTLIDVVPSNANLFAKDFCDEIEVDITLPETFDSNKDYQIKGFVWETDTLKPVSFPLLYN